MPSLYPNGYVYSGIQFWTGGSALMGQGASGAWGLNPPADLAQADIVQSFNNKLFQQISLPSGSYALFLGSSSSNIFTSAIVSVPWKPVDLDELLESIMDSLQFDHFHRERTFHHHHVHE